MTRGQPYDPWSASDGCGAQRASEYPRARSVSGGSPLKGARSELASAAATGGGGPPAPPTGRGTQPHLVVGSSDPDKYANTPLRGLPRPAHVRKHTTSRAPRLGQVRKGTPLRGLPDSDKYAKAHHFQGSLDPYVVV